MKCMEAARNKVRVSENCLKGPRIITAPCALHLLPNQEKTHRSGRLNSHLVQELISWTSHGERARSQRCSFGSGAMSIT